MNILFTIFVQWPPCTHLNVPVSLSDGLRGAVPIQQCPEGTHVLSIGHLPPIADLPHQMVHCMPGDAPLIPPVQLLENILKQLD